MLNKIKFSYRIADKQKGLITLSHTLFKCKIKVDGLQYTFDYQCNTAYKEPNLMDCMYAIISDMIVSYCESRFDEEFTDICLHALQKLCRKRTEPMSAGRNNMWAAGIIYAIAQNCNMIGNNGNMLLTS